MAELGSNEKGSGWLEFAAVVMFAVGFFRIITAIGYFSNSHKINDLSNGLFSSHLWAWGVWDLLIAAAAFFGGLSILGGGAFGRVVGYIWAVLVIVEAFTIIGISPGALRSRSRSACSSSTRSPRIRGR